MATIDLQAGGTAELVGLDQDRATIKSPIASAPGSRLGLVVGGRSLRLKVHRCARDGDGYHIEGRFIDLTRDLRATLQARLANE